MVGERSARTKNWLLYQTNLLIARSFYISSSHTMHSALSTQHLGAGHASLLYSLRERDPSNYSRNCHYECLTDVHTTRAIRIMTNSQLITLSTIALRTVSGGLHTVLSFTGVSGKLSNYQRHKLWTPLRFERAFNSVKGSRLGLPATRYFLSVMPFNLYWTSSLSKSNMLSTQVYRIWRRTE